MKQAIAAQQASNKPAQECGKTIQKKTTQRLALCQQLQHLTTLPQHKYALH